jgi:hypothetical protein
MAAIWSQKWLHERAAQGFEKVGLSNVLDGSEDHLICRDARVFWDEMNMGEARLEAVAAVSEEVAAGRLHWSRDAVDQVVVLRPVRGRRLDYHPDDEGSASGHESAFTDDDVAGDDLSGGDDDDGGGGGQLPATAGIPGRGLATATAVSEAYLTEASGSALALLPQETSAVSEHLSRMSVLRSVQQQLVSTNCEALKVHVETAINAELRHARGQAKTHPSVARAIMLERERDMVDLARRQMRVVAGQEEKVKTALTIKALVEEQDRLGQARAELLKASTTVECMNALKSFEVTDLGNGHPTGGNAEHVRNRMNVLDRLRLRFPPLSPEQQNDWEWFKKKWDQARINRMDPKIRAAWGHVFKEMVLRLLRQLRDGDHHALSTWMDAEIREYFAQPSLRV